MKAIAVALVASLLCFLAGFRFTSVNESSLLANDSGWVVSSVPDEQWQKDALRRLAANTRWEVELEVVTDTQTVGDFSSDYRLLAVVDSSASYALLQKKQVKQNGTDTIFKVIVGDLLEDGWQIIEVNDASIKAQKNDETQSISLFPAQ